MTGEPVISGGGVLGQKVEGPRRQIDTFDLPAGVTRVTYTSDEVMSHCPITGQPDFYTVEIRLQARLGLESKSLKLYLQSFVDEGQFCEAFANRIKDDVVEASQASWCIVEVKQKPRGGITIKAVAEGGWVA
jgi:7-cyano-7-deazaguanine reductase